MPRRHSADVNCHRECISATGTDADRIVCVTFAFLLCKQKANAASIVNNTQKMVPHQIMPLRANENCFLFQGERERHVSNKSSMPMTKTIADEANLGTSATAIRHGIAMRDDEFEC